MIQSVPTYRRAALALALAGAALIGFSVTPARALDDGSQNIFETVRGLLGAGIGFGLGGEEKPRIDYRERAPLVLPPTTQLPPPAAPVSQRNTAWPRDYDAERMRRNQVQTRGVPNDYELGGTGMNAREIRTMGRLQRNASRDPNAESCRDGDLGELCNPTQFWRVMRTTSSGSATSRDLVAGQEPPRARLTDPPKGFRTAKSNQRYTFEVREEPSLNDPRAQLREEQRRARQVD